MKLLLDTCIWGGAVEALKAAGHAVIWAGAWDVDPGAMREQPYGRKSKSLV